MHPRLPKLFSARLEARWISNTFLLATLGLVVFATPRTGFAQTPLVNGSQWLGGQGVNAYDNGNDPSVDRGGNYLNNVYVGEKWQCVELAQRLYTTMNWYSGAFRYQNGTLVDTAYHIYDAAADMGMTTHINGDGNVPVPGDMIILQGTTVDSPGHVSLVDRVDNSNVYTVEQNWPYSSDRCTYARSGTNGSYLSRANTGYKVRGFIHSPKNSKGSGGSSTDIYVALNGDDSNNGGSGFPFRTVKHAVDQASSTQAVTIHIAPGSYGEKISTSKHIHFVTWGSGTVRIGN